MKKFILSLLILASFLMLITTACGSVSTNNNTTTATSPNNVQLNGTVQIENFTFTPATIEIKKGGTVTWTNKDSADHVIKFDAFNSSNMAQGSSFKHTFDTAGSFTYICGIHTYMTGTIIVK